MSALVLDPDWQRSSGQLARKARRLESYSPPTKETTVLTDADREVIGRATENLKRGVVSEPVDTDRDFPGL